MKYKKGSIVLHPKMDWGKGIVKERSDGKTVQVLFEKVGMKNLSLKYVELIRLDETSVPDIDLDRIDIKNRIYRDKPFVDIFSEIKLYYPDHLVIIENGCYYEVLYSDADYLAALYGWTIYERQHNVPMTGFPDNAKNIWNDLESLGKPYLIVAQLSSSGNKVKRKITEIYP